MLLSLLCATTEADVGPSGRCLWHGLHSIAAELCCFLCAASAVFTRRNECPIRGVCADMKARLVSISEQIVKLDAKVGLAMYAATSVLSEAAAAKVSGGAIFYLLHPDTRVPLCCGFFVSSRVALTVNHDGIFNTRDVPFDVPAIDSSANELVLRVVATNAEYDFTVLRVIGEERTAFFSVPSATELVQGNRLGLVSMGIASAARLRAADADDAIDLAARVGGGGAIARPAVAAALAPARLSTSFHQVTVSAVDPTYVIYDGATTWSPDSGALLLLHEGTPVGMHLEIVDDREEPAAGSKRPRLTPEYAHAAAKGSQSKVSRALLLSCSVVFGALEREMDAVAREARAATADASRS